jgi:glycosyltransferase involved in cell wall biosynthesis
VTGPAVPGLTVAFVLGSASGGTVSHVIALADGCRSAGAGVVVFGPADTLALLPDNTDAVAVPIGDRPRPMRDLRAHARLRAGLSERRPDVVHAHGVRAGAFAALAVGALAIGRVPGARPGRHPRPALVVTVHNAPPAGAASRIVYGLLERICARRADIVLCASADLLTNMRARGARAQQFDVPAPARSEPAAADVAAARSGIGAGARPVVLAVGRLAPQKGFDVLVDAAARWRDRDPQPRTAIAGAGPLAAQLQARARRRDADVVLLGARDDVPALLAAADVVVVPSRWEARALVVQEAMRSGRPVVAARVGGIPELTGADGALLVPPEDAAALADAVVAVLDDAPFAARLGAAAKRRSTTFPSERHAVSSMLATYARLASREPAEQSGATS